MFLAQLRFRETTMARRVVASLESAQMCWEKMSNAMALMRDLADNSPPPGVKP